MTMNKTENISLGSLIREERIKKGLTQAQLGRMIGLKDSRVSKIEKGAPITPEVASFILGKMGSRLQIKVIGTEEYDPEVLTFLMSAIYNFSLQKSIPLNKAYQYLQTFKGLEFLQQYYDIEQTLGNDEIVSDLTRVCANNGGLL